MKTDTGTHSSKNLALLCAALLLLAAVLSTKTPGSDARDGDASHSRKTAGPTLQLQIVDAVTRKPTAARFSLIVDGKNFVPEALNAHGLKFTSVHESKKQIAELTYARGSGVVELELPADAKNVAVRVAKGFEYLPVAETRQVDGKTLRVDVSLRRWNDLAKQGWVATDAHVHYDRADRSGDRDWLTMLAGDDLQQAHFMVLKGGKVPGLWARQYAYGKAGEAFDGERLIRSGEEYRDSAQGHINLLGLKEVIQPISTGGLGKPPVHVNYPPLADVFRKSRELGGFGGVAHGGSLGREPTAVLDVVLQTVDFFEITNAHLYSLELWYRLMNCGYAIPPAGGTDLPNFPYRDAWQPFLGSMRMYVQTGGRRDFQSWTEGVRAGKVFVTSGPLLSFSVDKAGPGGTIRLPAGGGEVSITAGIASPVGLKHLEVVQNGKPLRLPIGRAFSEGVQQWTARGKLRITESCWLAARGRGVPIAAMEASIEKTQPWIETDAVAHTGAVRVIVGGKPIRSAAETAYLVKLLKRQQEYYRTKGRYDRGEDRLRVLELFERGIAELEKRG